MASNAVHKMVPKNSIVMQRIAAVRIWMLGEGRFGVSESRCLGRCEHGPVAVVYPDDVWYQYIDEEDVDEIIESHLMGGKEVERLIIK